VFVTICDNSSVTFSFFGLPAPFFSKSLRSFFLRIDEPKESDVSALILLGEEGSVKYFSEADFIFLKEFESDGMIINAPPATSMHPMSSRILASHLVGQIISRSSSSVL
jgi:hypothetical protein